MADNTDTKRERIMAHLKERFEAQQKASSGPTPDAKYTWDVVTRLPLTKNEKEIGFAVGLYDTSERKRADIGRDMCSLNVVVEFHVKMMEGDDIPRIMNRVMGEVQRVMGLDIYCGQIANNVEEKGNELEIPGPNATSCAGMVVYEITYRHKSNNPYA
jgi:hypothetical protein